MDSSITVILTGLLVVFSVLILLTCLIWLFGKIVTAITGGSKKKSEPVKATDSPVASKAAVQSAPANSGISNEILAVIAAAVASLSDETGRQYAVRGVKRASSGRPVWSAAGLLENTRPF
ncbi:MAG: OadG family protein [Clostridiales bacterium]|nr:OadG family protein [Clostridiales bacterium]